jgi:probable H4MPT-linked C1 transfer pathway protein
VSRSALGLDVGGANLKAAHSRGAARSHPFALWKAPAALPDALRELLHDWPPYDRLAVTMTGELCDCFASKREGVRAILDAVSAVAGATPVRVWLTDGRLVDLAAARADPLAAAAANWLALATLAGRFAPRGPALLIDVGSTTSDVVPLLDGLPVPTGRTDPDRLRAEELVYTGVRRTPLCSLLGGYGAAEVFATTQDAYVVLGHLPEDAADTDTADGRPATRPFAEARLARMICADLETSTHDDRLAIAMSAVREQVARLAHAVESVIARLPGWPAAVVIAGSGEFLARAAWAEQVKCPPCPVISLRKRLGRTASSAACAHALAVIAAEAEP